MSEDEAGQIYEAMFWKPVHGDDLKAGVDYCMFDIQIQPAAVNAVHLLTEVLDLPATNSMTAELVAAANALDASELINKLCDAWFVHKQQSDAWLEYALGWANRNRKRRTRALAMTGE
jgi:lysozyme family protein